MMGLQYVYICDKQNLYSLTYVLVFFMFDISIWASSKNTYIGSY